MCYLKHVLLQLLMQYLHAKQSMFDSVQSMLADNLQAVGLTYVLHLQEKSYNRLYLTDAALDPSCFAMHIVYSDMLTASLKTGCSVRLNHSACILYLDLSREGTTFSQPLDLQGYTVFVAT